MKRITVPVNYAKLRGRIREKFGTQSIFAEQMGMDSSTLSAKLNKRTSWTLTEMEKACELLEIQPMQAYLYFFTA